MIEIGKLGEQDRASHYPKEVQEKILEAVKVFVESRDRSSYGQNSSKKT